MNLVLVISILAGLSAAGLFWFGWSLLAAVAPRRGPVSNTPVTDEPGDDE